MSSRLLAFYFAFAAPLLLGNASAQVVPSSGIGIGSGSSVRHGIQQNPISAEFVDKQSRVLSDGTRIDQERHEKYYRDSEGRTRTEHEFLVPNGRRIQNVTIDDVVQGLHIFLNPEMKTAQVHHYPTQMQPVPPRVAPQAPVVPIQNPPQISRLNQNHSEFSNENLGHMTIAGIDAIGTRTTFTTPANAIGNSQPIVRVSERWFSPELKLIVLTKSSDPEHGDSVHELVSLSRNEPDPALFQIPSDYTVTQISETLPLTPR